MSKWMLPIAICAMAFGVAGCGKDTSKAKEVLGLPETSYCSGYKTLEKSAELVEKQGALSVKDKELSEEVETALNNKIHKEWIPQLCEKAKALGVTEFKVSIDEDVGVLLIPGDAPRKFKGCVIGSVKAHGDEMHFIAKVEVSVQQDGSLKYEFKD